MTTQQTNLTDLLAAHPRTVKAVDKWLEPRPSLKDYRPTVAAHWLRSWANTRGYADAYFASLPDLLATIEARLTDEATPPLSDEEIAKMRWKSHPNFECCGITVYGELIDGGHFNSTGTAARNLTITAHNSDIDRLTAEIRRLRAKCGEVRP